MINPMNIYTTRNIFVLNYYAVDTQDIHGLVERIMKVIGIPAGLSGEKGNRYYLEPSHVSLMN